MKVSVFSVKRQNGPSVHGQAQVPTVGEHGQNTYLKYFPISEITASRLSGKLKVPLERHSFGLEVINCSTAFWISHRD